MNTIADQVFGDITDFTSSQKDFLEREGQLQRSLGEIAFLTRFPDENYQKQKGRIRQRWEEAAFTMICMWRIAATEISPQYGDYSLGAHLYAGVFSGGSQGYAQWQSEDTTIRELYVIAAHRIVKAVTSRVLTLQQGQIAGSFSERSLFPVRE